VPNNRTSPIETDAPIPFPSSTKMNAIVTAAQ
jgi:hypothetical protein